MCKINKKANEWESMIVSVGGKYLGGSKVERSRKKRIRGIIENM